MWSLPYLVQKLLSWLNFRQPEDKPGDVPEPPKVQTFEDTHRLCLSLYTEESMTGALSWSQDLYSQAELKNCLSFMHIDLYIDQLTLLTQRLKEPNGFTSQGLDMSSKRLSTKVDSFFTTSDGYYYPSIARAIQEFKHAVLAFEQEVLKERTDGMQRLYILRITHGLAQELIKINQALSLEETAIN